MRRLAVIIAFLAASPSVGRGQFVSGTDYAAELIARAGALELDRDLQWIRLGHWRRPHYPTRFVYYTSEADGAQFFLSPEGKTSPRAELEATLRQFVGSRVQGDQHPICRFPARFHWLNQKLRFDTSRMQVPACPKFTEFVTSMKPSAVIVVFSSYFMTRAASAFGHTFMRIERDDPNLVADRRQLLDTGIDYSATATTTNPLLYALLGLTGGFRGAFSKLPYYYKVREYNDFESRDLWEYKLALTPEQRSLLVAHLWEVGQTYFDYFYMTENCSYHILGVIDVARPELGLIEKLRVPVVPADTVKALTEVPGLVSEITYRPSLDTQFRARVADLDDRQRELVSTLARRPETPLPASMPEPDKVAVLDAAADLVDLLWAEEILDPRSEGARHKLALLSRRASIRTPSRELSIEPPWHDQPHRAHDSSRLGFGGGWRQGVGPFTSISGRANLHDLLDNPNGYPEQSAIEFLPFEARLYSDPDDLVDNLELVLESFSLVKITQLSSFSSFDKKIAWSVNTGGERIRDEGCADCFAGVAELGGGVARSGYGNALTVYSLFDTAVHWAPALDGYGSTGFRVGVGPRAGVRLRLRNNLIGMAEAKLRWLPGLEPTTVWSAHGAFRWQMAERFALDLEALSGTSTDLEARGSLLHYF